MSHNTPNTEVYSQVDQRTDANPDGTILGQSATDRIAFYGKVPVTQKVPGTALGGLNSSYINALSTGTATSYAWGYQVSTVVDGATTWSFASVTSNATMNASTNLGIVLTDVVNTLIGLGIWKAASV